MTVKPQSPRAMRLFTHGLLCSSALLLVSACSEPLDFDLRGNFGKAPSTAAAARQATANRPKPDDRGIISYPGYQVAVARRGDTLGSLAARIGADAGTLARYNGVQPGDSLRQGEIVALPARVAEPSPATGAITTGPIQPPSNVDITTLAGNAIDRSAPVVQTTPLAPQIGFEPTRHKVTRGETAYTVARLYNVSVRSLAEWNGLGPDFAVREGQYLLIPTADPTAAPTRPVSNTVPGQGTPTPVPPSATKPLPAEKTAPVATAAVATTPTATAAAKPTSPAPDLGKTQTKASTGGKFAYPTQGKIIRTYSKGKSDGIDISAPAGTPIVAAEAGTVAAITADADQVPIIVVKHANNILTVYANVGDIAVQKGAAVRRGQKLAAIRSRASNYVHFEVRKGFDSVDPMPYLQ